MTTKNDASVGINKRTKIKEWRSTEFKCRIKKNNSDTQNHGLFTESDKLLMKWEYTQLRFVPRGKSWTGEIEELWLDDQQIISRRHPQKNVTLVGLMNELGEQGRGCTVGKSSEADVITAG